MFWLRGLQGAFIGSMFFVAALFLWTVPSWRRQPNYKMDPMQRKVSETLLGVGLGMIGGLAAAVLLPPPWSWLVFAAVAVGLLVWQLRRS